MHRHSECLNWKMLNVVSTTHSKRMRFQLFVWAKRRERKNKALRKITCLSDWYREQTTGNGRDVSFANMHIETHKRVLCTNWPLWLMKLIILSPPCRELPTLCILIINIFNDINQNANWEQQEKMSVECGIADADKRLIDTLEAREAVEQHDSRMSNPYQSKFTIS